MKKRIVPFFICFTFLGFTGCNIIKTIKVLKKGEVAQKNFKETVSFESRAGLVIVKVNIQGKDYQFIYDSGATNAVTKELAETLGLKPVLDQTAEDSEGKKGGIKFAMIDDLKLGKVSFLNTAAAIIDLNAITELACLEVDGLIGGNLMRKACWQIDYEKKLLTFASSIDSLSIASNAFSFPFSPLISGTPVVDVELEGVKSKGNIFDTGSSGEITLSASTFKKVLKQNPTFKYVRGIGSSSAGLYGKGYDTSYVGKTNALKMGSLVLTDCVVDFKRAEGNLGSGFFKDYIVTLDWKQNKIWFAPQPKEKQAWETFGFSTIKNDTRLFVSYLVENSPAAMAGVTVGDQVVSVNGKYYDIVTNEEYCEMIVKQVPWKKEKTMVLIFKSQNGAERTVTLEKKALFN